MSASTLQTMSAVTCYDEMHGSDGEIPGGEILAHYRHYSQWLASQPSNRILQKRHEAEVMFHRVGITFAVYGE